MHTEQMNARYASTTDKATIKILEDLSQPIRDRLAHIEFTLAFKGEAIRVDLIERFGIAPAQATKDFTLYREIAPENITYDSKRRIHLRGKNFKHLFNFDYDRTLSTIANGCGDGFVGRIPPITNIESNFRLNRPKINILASISEAIFKNAVLEIEYASSYGTTKREIVPHSLVDNGLRWHVRAFDRRNAEFRDFVLTRIKSAKVIAPPATKSHKTESRSQVAPREQAPYDRLWNRELTLILVPHPDNVENKEAIALDFEMDKNQELEIVVRAAVAPYILGLWNVDCTPEHSLHNFENKLWLKNFDELRSLPSLVMVPGAAELEAYFEQ